MSISLLDKKGICYSFRLYFLDNTSIQRHCIASENVTVDQLILYLTDSLSQVCTSIQLVKKEKVVVLETLIKEEQKRFEGLIDAFWIDVIIYTVSRPQGHQTNECLVIGGIDSTEEEVKRMFTQTDSTIKPMVEWWGEGWLKRR